MKKFILLILFPTIAQCSQLAPQYPIAASKQIRSLPPLGSSHAIDALQQARLYAATCTTRTLKQASTLAALVAVQHQIKSSAPLLPPIASNHSANALQASVLAPQNKAPYYEIKASYKIETSVRFQADDDDAPSSNESPSSHNSSNSCSSFNSCKTSIAIPFTQNKLNTSGPFNISEEEWDLVRKFNKGLHTFQDEKSKREYLDKEMKSNNENPLIYAAKRNFHFLAKYLLSQGADPLVSDDGFTQSLDIAKRNGNTYIQTILQHTISRNIAQSKANNTYYAATDPVIMGKNGVVKATKEF